MPTTSVPAPVNRPAAQPSGTASATLITIRAHSAGISPGRCRALATASLAPTPTAPTTAPSTVAPAPQRPATEAPASIPTTPATPTDPARPPPSSDTPAIYPAEGPGT